jgi:hypothetical protein
MHLLALVYRDTDRPVEAAAAWRSAIAGAPAFLPARVGLAQLAGGDKAVLAEAFAGLGPEGRTQLEAALRRAANDNPDPTEPVRVDR